MFSNLTTILINQLQSPDTEMVVIYFAIFIVITMIIFVFSNRWSSRHRRPPEEDDAFHALPTIPRVRRAVVTDNSSSATPVDQTDGTAVAGQRQLRRRTHGQRREVSLGRQLLRAVGVGGHGAEASNSSDTSGSGSSPRDTSPVRNTEADEDSGIVSNGTATSASKRIRHRRHSQGAYGLMKNLLPHSIRSSRQRHGSYNLRQMPRPPDEFFEPSPLTVEVPTHLSPDIFYVLHYLKVLEPPTEWILNPADIETRTYEPGEYVFKPGDADIYLYVVLDGALAVSILDASTENCSKPQSEYKMKEIRSGEAVYSLLTILDVITGSSSIFRTVCGKTITKTTISRYRLTALRDAFLSDPNAWIRPIQIIITRLMHVTMTTLYHYLGLSPELTKPTVQSAIFGQSNSGPDCEKRMRHASAPGQRTDRRRRHSGDVDTTDDKKIEHLARKRFAQVLGLEGENDMALLQDRVSVECYSENAVVVDQGTVESTNLYLVLHGSIKLTQRRSAASAIAGVASSDQDEPSDAFDRNDGGIAGDKEITVSICYQDELIGGLQLLSGEPSFYTLRTRTSSKFAVIKANDFYHLMALKPSVILPVCRSVLSRLSPFMRGVDFALDWQMVDSGTALYRQGDPATCLHVVISGRLRSVVAAENKKEAVEEFGRGDMVGLVEVLMNESRASTVLAVRFSQLAKIPHGLLNYIRLKFPEVGFRIILLLGHYYNSAHRKLTGHFSNEPLTHVRNLHTLAVMPANRNVPLVPFTCELYHAIRAYTNANVLMLTSRVVAEHLDPAVLEKASDFRLMNWLNSQEDTYTLVIYECDFELTAWTRRCLHQADALIVVANGDDSPSLGFLETEQSLMPEGVRTNRELILLWPESTERPRGTFEWIKTRGWFSGHHHVRAPDRMYRWSNDVAMKPNTPMMEKSIVSYYEKNVYTQQIDIHSDFARVARLLTGNAVGLVLGGGGARGAAHIGMIKAMHENGIPIDAVAGVSIGSLIGGLYCADPNGELLHMKARPWFMDMTSIFQKLRDVTYCHAALLTGSTFNHSIQKCFGDLEIDDLWIPYFCVTTDLTTHEMRVHKNGPLWAYCRASMTLAGYLPPLCDPQDGHYLLDGGYVNNLPADVMYTLGFRRVIAVDVGSESETQFFNYGDSLSGTWVLWNRLNPWSETARIMDLNEIQHRLAYVSCVRTLEQVKKAPYVRYVRPPVEKFKTLDFGKFDEIYKIGDVHAQRICRELLSADDKFLNLMLPRRRRRSELFVDHPMEALTEKIQQRRKNSLASPLDVDHDILSSRGSRNRMMTRHGLGGVSFTDLAAAVSAVPGNMRRADDSLLDDLPDVWEEDSEDESGRTSAQAHANAPASRDSQQSTSDDAGMFLNLRPSSRTGARSPRRSSASATAQSSKKASSTDEPDLDHKLLRAHCETLVSNVNATVTESEDDLDSSVEVSAAPIGGYVELGSQQQQISAMDRLELHGNPHKAPESILRIPPTPHTSEVDADDEAVFELNESDEALSQTGTIPRPDPDYDVDDQTQSHTPSSTPR